MDHLILFIPFLNEKISDLLAEYPQLTTFFMKHHTACVGCGFSSFCNLQDALKFYKLDAVELMEDFQKLVRTAAQNN